MTEGMGCLVAFGMAIRCFFDRLLILKKVACAYQPKGYNYTVLMEVKNDNIGYDQRIV